MDKIVIKDAHENNLKHLNLEIPLNQFTCVTGCSGCGKSSLVFDTIYAESQRAFLEGITGNIYGQKLMDKPQVGSIENLRPALNISQTSYNVNPRSTIGTITELSYYLRSLFSIINSDQHNIIPEKLFSYNNPKSFCPHCLGLGVETIVSESLLVPDMNIALKDGGILYFKGSTDSKEQKYLEALCQNYGIDINKKISQLSKNELHILLYSDEKIRFKLAYKEGKRKKQHYVMLQGAIPSILDRIADDNKAIISTNYSKYTEQVTCHVCKGAKLAKEVLTYKVCGLNYYEVESMELYELYEWLNNLKDDRIFASKQKLVEQLIVSMKIKLEALIKLDIAYLSLNRSVTTLSGGEKQRVRLATQLSCSLKGLLYILDEPCKGLHYKDIIKIISITKDLVARDNTVIAIEHNKQYIASSDYVLELGAVGGPNGGYIVNQTNKPKKVKYKFLFKPQVLFSDYLKITHINFRNIKEQNVYFPLGGITCITGVSGSGKSSLATVVSHCVSRKYDRSYGTIYGAENVRRVIKVDQAPIGKTARSTIVSYLEIYDEIRNLFANTEEAKKHKLGTSLFSMNVKGGRCECCQGTGLQKIDLNYLPTSYIECPECNGKRFNEQILSITYHNKTILDVLEIAIDDLIEVFDKKSKTYHTLSIMIELGLGYLKLGQMSMHLSGGEAQRIKLAKALSSLSHGKNLYILDEPTTGLNSADIDKFINILDKLQKNKETIIIIEHNLEFIAKIADYIVDFGLAGGKNGGVIVAQGVAKSVFSNEASSLYAVKNM